jgi:hypothetical protein
VISIPTIGSASGKLSATPQALANTANDVKPSVRACRPSATSAGRTDSAADADPVRRHQLVADESDETRGGHPAHVLDRHRVNQSHDSLVPGDDGRQGDHRNDEEPGEIFGATEAVGVATRRRPSAERERDP